LHTLVLDFLVTHSGLKGIHLIDLIV